MTPSARRGGRKLVRWRCLEAGPTAPVICSVAATLARARADVAKTTVEHRIAALEAEE